MSEDLLWSIRPEALSKLSPLELGEGGGIYFRYVKVAPDGEVIKHHSRQVIIPKCMRWGKWPAYQNPDCGVWDRIMSQIPLLPQEFTILLLKDVKTFWHMLGFSNSTRAQMDFEMQRPFLSHTTRTFNIWNYLRWKHKTQLLLLPEWLSYLPNYSKQGCQ